MKTSLINSAKWEDFARDRLTWKMVKTGAAIQETNRATAAKAKREDRKSKLSPPRKANTLPPQHARGVSELCKHQSVSQDTFGRNAPTTRKHILLLPLSPLPPTPRRQPPRHSRSHCRCLVDINPRHHPHSPSPCVDQGDQQHQHHDLAHSPPHRLDHVRRPITCYHQHQYPHNQ
nr:unnamed protein product [Spirometra erinaceieuropaei]